MTEPRKKVLGKSQCSLTIGDKKLDSIIINTYVNPKQYNLQPLRNAIEELELTREQEIYMGDDFNANDPSDIDEKKQNFQYDC